jgi:hypothetical protein
VALGARILAAHFLDVLAREFNEFLVEREKPSPCLYVWLSSSRILDVVRPLQNSNFTALKVDVRGTDAEELTGPRAKIVKPANDDFVSLSGSFFPPGI